jgi:hypothetical protein
LRLWPVCVRTFFESILKQAGVKDVTWIKFGDLGIQRNAHFFYLEENNLQLAKAVEGEIKKSDANGKLRMRRVR